jgi:hypothetical protein
MKPSNLSQRSDEIRRRRMAQSHAAHQATQGRKRPSTLLRWLKLPKLMAGRSRKSKKTVGNGLSRHSHPYEVDTQSPPPVMARGSTSGSGLGSASGRMGNRRQKSGRKLYNVPLKTRGSDTPIAEMRISSLPHIGFSWRVASFGLLVLMAVSLYLLWTSPMYLVEKPKVHGLKQITTSDVSRALAMSGKPVFALNPARMQQDLLDTFPEFSAAAVQIELPNTVNITVTERTPALVWKQDDRSYLIDTEGMTFPAREGSDLSVYITVEATGPLPIGVTGLITSTQTSPSVAEEKQQKNQGDGSSDALRSLGALADQLPFALPLENTARPFLPKEMVAAVLLLSEQLPKDAQLIYDPVRGFGWQDRRGWQVYMGNFEDIALKEQVYRAILEKIRATGEKPSLISVEFVHAPYYRLEAGE